MADTDESLSTKIYDGCYFFGEVVVLLVRMTIAWWCSVYRVFVPPEPKDVKGEIVLITGTGHGMGREMALRFARLGSVVVCVDVNAKGNQETVDMIKALNLKVHQYQCDVTDRAAVLALGDRVAKEVGVVSILVNNAGIMPCRPVLDHSEREIRSVLDINVNGNLWMIQAFLPGMIERNHGHIVAMSSMAGMVGVRNLVPYCGSKWAVRGIMEALKIELTDDERNLDGINLTTVCPSAVDTGLCHKPRFKRPALVSLVPPEDAADQIVDAVRRNYLDITIPSDLFYSQKIFRFVPFSVAMLLNSFIGSGLDAHDPET